MWYHLERTIDLLRVRATQMDPRDWLVLLVAVLAVGFFCMRGFGSRTSY